jgi:hypothetical protein
MPNDHSMAGALRLLSAQGYALLEPADAASELGVGLSGLDRLRDSWSRLPRDTYLLDGGRYRFRRHSCYVQEFAPAGTAPMPGSAMVSPQRIEPASALTPVAGRAHWQPTAYNALHGGLERWFESVEPTVSGNAAWIGLLTSLGSLFRQVRKVARWYIEAHQFRIDTEAGIGRPTPEGAHRDGVDFVAVILVQRRSVRGGETRVFDAAGPAGVRFTMSEPWSMLLMDDERVIHETTPIQPDGAAGVRDTLVLTYRAAGFQAPG